MPFILSVHLNHPANQSVLPSLCSRISSISDGAHRLLKLLCSSHFNPSRYANRDPDIRFRGAYGTVYKAYLPSEPFEVAVKIIDMPKTIHDPCTIADLFTEVTIMEHLRLESRICQIIDYGVDSGSYYIATAWYRMSLKSWRMKQPEDSLAKCLPMYLSICAKLINAVCCLEEYQVVHYDLKVSVNLLVPVMISQQI